MPGIFDRVADHLKTKNMKTGNDYVKEAEQESMKELGEISKDFIIGYLSQTVKILNEKKTYDDGYEDGFQTAVLAEKGIKRLAEINPDKLFDAVKVICDDYNAKILKP